MFAHRGGISLPKEVLNNFTALSSYIYTITMKAGIYARISQDTFDTTLGVQRQIEDCTREAKRRDWEVVETYVDNDVSATRSKVRPAYERMMSDIEQGHINAMIVWDIDRLTRTPRELEDIIDLADRMNLSMANIGGEIDLSTPQGKLTARIKGSVARHESEQMSRRLKRAFTQRALSGKPHSYAPYGFTRTERDGEIWDEVNEEQAEVIREAANRYVAGESLRAICTDLMRRGIPAPKTNNWSATSLRQILLRPVNIGLRKHNGEIVGKCNADPLMSESLFNQVNARMFDPERIKHAQGPKNKYLLSTIARCGKCGGKMAGQAKHEFNSKKIPSQYYCKECYKIRRKREPIDEIITGAIIARLGDPKLVSALSKDVTGELPKLRERMEGLKARLDIAADNFAEGTITGEQMKRINTKIVPELDELKRKIGHLEGSNPILSLSGANAAERWAKAPLEIQRKVVGELMSVVIMPAGAGGKFDPELIKIEWKV